jgi:hypothetical protein
MDIFRWRCRTKKPVAALTINRPAASSILPPSRAISMRASPASAFSRRFCRFGFPQSRQGTGFHATFLTRAGFILGQCCPFGLVTAHPAVTMAVETLRRHPPEEVLMSKNKVAALLAAFALGFAALPAGAQTTNPPQKPPKDAKRQYDNRGHLYYGPSGPNVSYQDGPHTRVFITKRSWLDAGTEVLPGDRKFTDYAFPPELGYPSFSRENNNRPIDRQPTNPPSDMGGYPARIPLPY